MVSNTATAAKTMDATSAPIMGNWLDTLLARPMAIPAMGSRIRPALRLRRLGQPALLFAQLPQRLGERVACLRAVAAQFFKPLHLVFDFSVDELAGVAQAKACVQALAGLGYAPAGIVVRAPQQQAGAALAAAQKQQADALFAQMAQQARLQRRAH